MQLLRNTYLMGGGEYGYSDPRDCNVYLIDGGGEMALVDSGGGKAAGIIRNIQSFGFNLKDIKYLINTHCHFDHIGGNKKIKEVCGCEIAVHEAEVAAVENLEPELVLMRMAEEQGLDVEPAKVDMVLRERDILNVGDCELRVFHTPGHSPGCICLSMERDEKKLLFTGDTLLAQGRLSWTNGPGFDLTAYKRSLERLVELKEDAIFPGHGTFVLSEAQEHVRLYSEKVHAPWVNIVTSMDLQKIVLPQKR